MDNLVQFLAQSPLHQELIAILNLAKALKSSECSIALFSSSRAYMQRSNNCRQALNTGGSSRKFKALFNIFIGMLTKEATDEMDTAISIVASRASKQSDIKTMQLKHYITGT
ncbi:putative outer membrane protein [Trichinella spiralis]|uniref:putative outer membrane protein n=1 Tax=Trichinella spiralis TaxID=6334 RepID=UPI0001EFDD69|nr:putative outer membrane protein [Trichinella spiralis]